MYIEVFTNKKQYVKVGSSAVALAKKRGKEEADTIVVQQ